MILGVLSDTHMPRRARELPPQVLDAFRGVDLILHAGDLNDLEMLNPLRQLAEVRAVVGNTDPWSVGQVLPERLEFEAAGVRIGLVHGHLGHGRTTPERASSWFPSARVVVFGHSHLPLIESREGALLLNPGSPTDRRQAPTCSCARLYLEENGPRAELVTW